MRVIRGGGEAGGGSIFSLSHTLTSLPQTYIHRSAGAVLTNPEAIKEVHRQYYAAGADIATAASYQASVEGYMKAAGGKCSSREEAEALIRRAVELAKEARDEFWEKESKTCSNREKRPRPLVAASVGCYGAAQADGSEYRGQYGLTEEELMAWHRPRLRILAQTGADLLAFETVPCEVELRAILRLLQEGEQEEEGKRGGFPPCWITVACRDGTHLNSGDSLESCAKSIVDAAAAAGSSSARTVAFGVNCTPPQYVEEALGVIARVFAAAAVAAAAERDAIGSSLAFSLPLLICYPNSGEIWEDKQWKAGTGVAPTPEAFADLAEKWVAAGARIVGGCCRTTPETIAALRARLVKEED